jgi:uncharacterized protein (DUF58 family)
VSSISSLKKSWQNSIIERIKKRVRATRGPLSPPVTLEYRHVFVMPTKFGAGFGFMLVFMLLGGLNFNNNMALMLVFLLGTVTQMTSYLAYRNLVGLNIQSVKSEPVFAGGDAHFSVFIKNPDQQKRYALTAGFKQPQDCADFEPDGSGGVKLSLPASQRGWLNMPDFRLETRFPLGLFKAWSWIFPSHRCLVYPAPAKRPPPLPVGGRGESGQAQKGDGEQVHGLRKYQAGDSRQRIAWRASARHDKMYSLEMETPRDDACELNWDSLQGTDAEARLSILTAWVLAADHRNIAYSLITPAQSVPAGSGPDQRARCLQLLALY